MTRNRSVDLFFNIVVIIFSLVGLVSTASNLINKSNIINNSINIVLNGLLYLSFFYAYGINFMTSKGKVKSRYFREVVSISICLYSLSMILLSGYYNSVVNYAFLLSLILFWQSNRSLGVKLTISSLLVATYIIIGLLQFFSVLPIFYDELVVNYEIHIIVERLISTFIILSIIITKAFFLLSEKYSIGKIALQLTPRQKEITILFQKGLTDKEIQDSLNLSPGTIKKHKHDIWKVLKVSTQNDFIGKIKNITF